MSENASRAERARREFVLRALAAGAFGALPAGGALAQTGQVPRKLPEGRSIYDLRGTVTVDGKAAGLATRIGAGALVETGPGASVTFAVGADAFLLREKSRMQLAGSSSTFVTLMRIATGAVLSVFGSGRKQVQTSVATIGIRGTGLYVEAGEERSYVCLCYGAEDTERLAAILPDLGTLDDPAVRESLVSQHHDAPRYVMPAGAKQRVQAAPFVNHSDLELMLLENLVGRSTPFSLFDESYGSQRRY